MKYRLAGTVIFGGCEYVGLALNAAMLMTCNPQYKGYVIYLDTCGNEVYNEQITAMCTQVTGKRFASEQMVPNFDILGEAATAC